MMYRNVNQDFISLVPKSNVNYWCRCNCYNWTVASAFSVLSMSFNAFNSFGDEYWFQIFRASIFRFRISHYFRKTAHLSLRSWSSAFQVFIGLATLFRFHWDTRVIVSIFHEHIIISTVLLLIHVHYCHLNNVGSNRYGGSCCSIAKLQLIHLECKE